MKIASGGIADTVPKNGIYTGVLATNSAVSGLPYTDCVQYAGASQSNPVNAQYYRLFEIESDTGIVIQRLIWRAAVTGAPESSLYSRVVIDDWESDEDGGYDVFTLLNSHGHELRAANRVAIEVQCYGYSGVSLLELPEVYVKGFY